MANRLIDEIVRIIETKGISAEAWSEKAGLGKTFVKDIRRGRSRSPSADRLEKLALAVDLPRSHFSSLSPDETVADQEPNLPHRSNAPAHMSASHGHSVATGTLRPVELVRDLPLFDTFPSREAGVFLMNKASVRNVGRPERLAGRPDVCVCYVQTKEMENRYFAGELIFFETGPPPAIDDFVLVELVGEGDGMRRMILRRLVSIAADRTIRVKQLNPERTTTIKPNDYVRMYRVLRGNDLV